MSLPRYDAIVVGSGITGGWAAKELCERGLKTLMLERGRNVEHITDYVNATRAPWELPHRSLLPTDVAETYPVVRRARLLLEANANFWANEKESPYTEVKPFDWLRGYQVGGRSLTWGRHCYRWSDLDFEANSVDGTAIDWPLRYADVSPWYDRVESFIGVSGAKEGLAQLPDGNFLPPIDLNIVEKTVADRIKRHYNSERRIINSRVANLTAAKDGRGPCQYRDKCWLGCPYGAYFSTQSSTLPAAAKTGNLTLRPMSIVRQILFDKNTKRARGVEVLDVETNQTYEFEANVVFVCASTFNSTWLLMNSATDVWPDGLGSSSGELGHNVLDHHSKIGATGQPEGFDDKYYYGRRPCGFYVPRFRNLGTEKRPYLRGFAYQGSASRLDWNQDIAEVAIGAPLKEQLSEPGAWNIGLSAFGETLPHHDNRIYLDKTKKDKWGLPTLAFDCQLRENEAAMRREMISDAVEMLEVAGMKNVRPNNPNYTFGEGIHEMGTARMGRDPKTSVLNSHNQVWDATNVFVTDGASMASSGCVNPSLTYMALTARAVSFAVDELKRRNL
ncbi:MAG: GMC family oxidoreductase [Gemmatimonadaceae bacterium]